MADIQPIKDELLAAIRRNNTFEFHNSYWAVRDINALLAEVERLRTENAAMRPIVEEVAKARILLTPTLLIHDDGSREEGPMLEHLDWSDDTEASVHVWRQARAFIAAHPAREE